MIRKAILEVVKRSEAKSRICLFDNCDRTAIKSHVLQKNGILREISENNHLIQLLPPSPFEIDKKGILDFKLVGINDVYTFQGFCSKHDAEIFKPIEIGSNLDFDNRDQQALFCYRGLCQEIRRKEIAKEWIGDLLMYFSDEDLIQIDSFNDGLSIGLKNLGFFKTEFEECMKSNNYDQFYLETIKIPRIELCISVPLNIGEMEIPDDGDYDKWIKHQLSPLAPPLAASFINVFPRKNDSMVICGYHKSYPCQWTIDFIKKIKNRAKRDVFKELSDLITLRLEFWAMSSSLFSKIDSKKIDEYKNLFTKNIYDHSPELKTRLNLFEILESED